MSQRKKNTAGLTDIDTLQNNLVRFEILDKRHGNQLLGSSAMDDIWRWMPAADNGSGTLRYLDYVHSQCDTGKMVAYSIFRKSDDAFAGVAGFTDIDTFHRRLRVGFAWHPEGMRGSMILPSAQMLLIQHAYEWYAKRISWHVPADHERGLNAMALLGATREAKLRNYIRTAEGRWSDVIVFSMIRAEMKQAVTRVETMITAASGAEDAKLA